MSQNRKTALPYLTEFLSHKSIFLLSISYKTCPRPVFEGCQRFQKSCREDGVMGTIHSDLICLKPITREQVGGAKKSGWNVIDNLMLHHSLRWPHCRPTSDHNVLVTGHFFCLPCPGFAIHLLSRFGLLNVQILSFLAPEYSYSFGKALTTAQGSVSVSSHFSVFS